MLELGGKDPFVVCDDVDLRHAAALCMRGVFQNSGQNCIGVERVFAHAGVKKRRFLEIVLAKSRRRPPPRGRRRYDHGRTSYRARAGAC